MLKLSFYCFLAIVFTSQTGLAVWSEPQSISDAFENQSSNRKIIRIDIGSTPEFRQFRISIDARNRAVARELRSHFRQAGFHVNGEHLGMEESLHMTIPVEQPNRVRDLIEVLNLYEPIEPNEVLNRMKAQVDIELASIHRYFNPSPRLLRRALFSPSRLDFEANVRAGVRQRNPDRHLQGNQYRIVSPATLSAADELETQCAICLFKLSEVISVEVNTRVAQANCGNARGGHYFCKSCIEEAYQFREECPVCRQRILVEEENLVENSQAPFIVQLNTINDAKQSLNEVYNNSAKAFCTAKGKSLIRFETRDFIPTSSSILVIYGDSLNPRQIPPLAQGQSSYQEFTMISCGH